MSEWSIHELAQSCRYNQQNPAPLRQSRTPRTQPNRRGGYRFYDEDALLRLQRILLLRELGLGLTAIAEILAGSRATITASAHPSRAARQNAPEFRGRSIL